MSVVLMDSFDGYATGQLLSRFSTLYLATIAAGEGRNGTNALKINDNVGYATMPLPSSFTTLYTGFSFRLSAFDGTYPFLRFYEGETIHVDLRIDATGKMLVTRNGTVLHTTSDPVISTNTAVHLQIKVIIHDTAGSVEVLLNGVSIINLTDIDTKNGGVGSIDNMIFTGHNSANTYIDDWWVSDSEFLGDCRIECLLPSGAGATTAWTPSSGNNYECVDDATPNSDTDYVSSSTADQIDTYAFGNLATTAGAVKGVQISAFARKDDAGSRNIALVARPGSTDRVGDTKALADSYNYYSQILDENPDTEAAWTISEVNASEFGVKLVS